MNGFAASVTGRWRRTMSARLVSPIPLTHRPGMPFAGGREAVRPLVGRILPQVKNEAEKWRKATLQLLDKKAQKQEKDLVYRLDRQLAQTERRLKAAQTRLKPPPTRRELERLVDERVASALRQAERRRERRREEERRQAERDEAYDRLRKGY